jgi:hypothetical protein
MDWVAFKVDKLNSLGGKVRVHGVSIFDGVLISLAAADT